MMILMIMITDHVTINSNNNYNDKNILVSTLASIILLLLLIVTTIVNIRLKNNSNKQNVKW